MAITCPRCHHSNPLDSFDGTAAVPCPACGAELEFRMFPAAGRGRGASGEPVGADGNAGLREGEASCFFCEGQVATAACETCGRFICDRCKVDWAGHLTCLSCIHANREIKDNDLFKSRRVIHDNVALSILLWPLVVPVYGLFFSLVISPVSLYLAIRHWNSSRGLVPRGRFRLVVTIVLSLLLLGSAMAGIAALMIYA